MGDIRTGNGLASAPVAVLVEYLVEHAGRWVPGSELADVVYGGVCADSAPRVLVARARARGYRIESTRAGYRVGRPEAAGARCPKCARLRVRYEGEWVCYGCPSTAVVDLEVGRAGPVAGTQQGQRWRREEERFVWEHRAVMSYEELGEALDRSASGVRGLFGLRGWDKPYVRSSEREPGELCAPGACVAGCEAEKED